MGTCGYAVHPMQAAGLRVGHSWQHGEAATGPVKSSNAVRRSSYQAQAKATRCNEAATKATSPGKSSTQPQAPGKRPLTTKELSPSCASPDKACWRLPLFVVGTESPSCCVGCHSWSENNAEHLHGHTDRGQGCEAAGPTHAPWERRLVIGGSSSSPLLFPSIHSCVSISSEQDHPRNYNNATLGGNGRKGQRPRVAERNRTRAAQAK